MKEVLRLNPISPLIDTVFGDKYKLVAESEAPVGILVRSFKMHDYEPAKSVLCVGRAGAGAAYAQNRFGRFIVVHFETAHEYADRGFGFGDEFIFVAENGVDERTDWV